MIPTGIEEKLNKLLESQKELLQLQMQNSEQLKTIADLNKKLALQAQTIAEQAETIAYLKKAIFGSKSEKSKNFNIPGQLSFFRDETLEDIENFTHMIDRMAAVGMSTVRMGSIVEKTFNYKNNVDYGSLYRTEFGDVAIFSECDFFIGDLSGILEFPKLFGKPIAGINCANLFNYNDANHIVDLFIFRKLYNTRKEKYLTLKEIAELQCELWEKIHK